MKYVFIFRLERTDFSAIWSSLLAIDALVFGLTLARVLRVGRKWRGSLFTLMLRDGRSCCLTSEAMSDYAHRSDIFCVGLDLLHLPFSMSFTQESISVLLLCNLNNILTYLVRPVSHRIRHLMLTVSQFLQVNELFIS